MSGGAGREEVAGEAAVCRHRLIKQLRLTQGILEGSLGEGAREAKFVDHRLRVDTDISRPAEHLDDHSLTVAQVGREPHHLHDELVSIGDTLRSGIPHRNRSCEGGAVDLHPAAARLGEIRAHKPGRSSLDHLDDFASRPRPPDVAAL